VKEAKEDTTTQQPDAVKEAKETTTTHASVKKNASTNADTSGLQGT
jgi:hypothetical protein